MKDLVVKVIYNEQKGLYQTQGTGIDFSGASVQAGDVSTDTIRMSVNTTTSDITVNGESIILCDATSNDITVTLPDVSTNDGRILHVKKIDASGNMVTVSGQSGQLIDGETTQIITAQYVSMQLVASNSGWFII